MDELFGIFCTSLIKIVRIILNIQSTALYNATLVIVDIGLQIKEMDWLMKFAAHCSLW